MMKLFVILKAKLDHLFHFYSSLPKAFKSIENLCVQVASANEEVPLEMSSNIDYFRSFEMNLVAVRALQSSVVRPTVEGIAASINSSLRPAFHGNSRSVP